MKILLLGKSGMLGSCFLKYFAGEHGLGDGDHSWELFAFDREAADICDYGRMKKIFCEVEPDIVINCVAYTNVDQAEEEGERDLVMKVNGYAVGKLANLCEEHSARLVHFSTDYVFDGESEKSWQEDSLAGEAVNVYGQSKLLGETLIKDSECEYAIIRTAWLFGENGKNFVDTMLGLAEKHKELKVVDDQFGCPTYTHDLVMAVVENFLMEWQGDGVFHLVNDGSCSWFEFAKEIFKLAGKEVEVKAVDSKAFPRPAKRPKYSVLENTKLKKMRSWQEAVKAYVDLPKKRSLAS